jgi:hypothetical protein
MDYPEGRTLHNHQSENLKPCITIEDMKKTVPLFFCLPSSLFMFQTLYIPVFSVPRSVEAELLRTRNRNILSELRVRWAEHGTRVADKRIQILGRKT